MTAIKSSVVDNYSPGTSVKRQFVPWRLGFAQS